MAAIPSFEADPSTEVASGREELASDLKNFAVPAQIEAFGISALIEEAPNQSRSFFPQGFSVSFLEPADYPAGSCKESAVPVLCSSNFSKDHYMHGTNFLFALCSSAIPRLHVVFYFVFHLFICQARSLRRVVTTHSTFRFLKLPAPTFSFFELGV